MSYRYMRVFVFFDMPRYTVAENKAANAFRKFLIKDGFLMLQESVYCKMALNQTASNAIKLRIKRALPEKGSILILQVTEKQFESMDICCDKLVTDVLNNDNRLVIL